MIPVSCHTSARRLTGHRIHVLRAVAAVALTVGVVAGCGGDDSAGTEDTTTVPAGVAQPRRLTAEETERLASFRFRAYGAKIRSIDGVVASDAATMQLRGWIDTVQHRGYAMVTGAGVAPFLVAWTQDTVSAQDFTGTEPPLPVPASGWTSTSLDPEVSQLAAAQVLLLSLSGTTPENPQLLRQSGATWLRSDRVGQVAVDVMSGPLPEGSTSSSYRFWVDRDGNLLRLEARLDGVHWSSFNLADASGVVLDG